MIELDNDQLLFRFPHLADDATACICFERTLRVPDTKKVYPLPAGLDVFPLRHVDDYADRLPERVLRRGGAIMPMWQAEAMWILFRGWAAPLCHMPYAVKIAAGKINAVSGEPWRNGLHRDPQDYCAVPRQPWLDGFKTERDTVRQFVAMPLGEGVTAEEQLTGAAAHGGLQIAVTPLTPQAFAEWRQQEREEGRLGYAASERRESVSEMGLAPGGLIQQVIHVDDRPVDHYDTAHTLRIFVTILDVVAWTHVTGDMPPHFPPTPKQYEESRLPWFELYESDVLAIAAADPLKLLKSIAQLGALGGSDQDVTPTRTIVLRPPHPGETQPAPERRGGVREWRQGERDS